MNAITLAAYEWVQQPDKMLAVVGGAALGGFTVVFLVMVIVRGWTGQKLPRWGTVTLGVVSGLLSGWLVALWIFGSGAGGLGGPGGLGFGGGNDKPPQDNKDKDSDNNGRPPDDWTRNVNTLYIEVLGEQTLKVIEGQKFDPERRYRVRTDREGRLLKLPDVVKYIKERREGEPPLKAITIVLYNDGPAPGTEWVDKLKQEAEVVTIPGSNQRVAVSTPRYKEDAPVK